MAEIKITSPITIKRKELLNQITKDDIIIIDLDNYQEIIEIIEIINNKQLQNTVKIKIYEKEQFNQFIFNTKLDYSNIIIDYDNDIDVTLKEYLNYEKQLYEMIKDTKKLSPFEKYIYVYNITKKFKEYKIEENDNNKLLSRSLYSILKSEYMVCVGFSYMLNDLLNKIGIKNIVIDSVIDSSYDQSNKNNEPVDGIIKTTRKEEHTRIYAYIKDEKYGIDGFYISDPTWDNDLEHDYYNHLALTDREINQQNRYNWLNTKELNELFNITTLKEYYHNLYYIKSSKDFFNLRFTYLQVIRIIQQLDEAYIQSLLKKYPFIIENKWPKEFNDLIKDIGEYLLEHVNKEISGTTIIEAISNVYKKVYGYNDEYCQIKMQELIKENRERQEEKFPKRFKIYEDGRIEVIMNEKNKFELDNSISSKTK